LSELLKEDITILEVLESEANKEAQKDKFNRLDMKVKNDKDEILLIEIQYDREMDYLQRILYASSKTITEHMKESDAYSQVVKVISISILYFNFEDGADYVYYGTNTFLGSHTKHNVESNKQQNFSNVPNVKSLYPEYYIIKIRNFDDNIKDNLDEWINFLKNATIPENPHAKGLLKAKETLDVLKMDAKERAEYEQYLKGLHDQASAYESTYVVGKIDGLKEGIEQGIAKEKENSRRKLEEIAKNLLDNALIQRLTKLRSWGVLKKPLQYINKTDLLKLQAGIHKEAVAQKDNFALWQSISITAEALKLQHALTLLESQGTF